MSCAVSDLDTLIKSTSLAVQDALALFAEVAADTRVRVGEWRAVEVLCHLVFWHGINVKGLESVLSGGQPYRVTASINDVNAQALTDMNGLSVANLLSELRALQGRLEKGARTLADPDVVVRIHSDGSEGSVSRQLRLITRHIGEHLEELQGRPPFPQSGR